MLNQTHLTFIGSGNMAEAMLAGLLQKKLLTPAHITAADPNPARRDHISHTYGVQTTAENQTATQNADIVILAIKPQYLNAVAPTLQLNPQTLLISILAGTSLQTLQNALSHGRIIRAMPNTPAQIGLGMTMWTATPNISPQQHQQAQQILASFGLEIYTPTENHIDMATAINGSGPAYAFLILETMIDTAVQIGFPRPTATTLVMQTMRGAIEYAHNAELPLTELRHRVTSPGGTTAAGLYAMQKNGLHTALTEGILAAYHRAQQLDQT